MLTQISYTILWKGPTWHFATWDTLRSAPDSLSEMWIEIEKQL